MPQQDFFTAKAGDWAIEALDNLFLSDGILAATLGLYNAIFVAVGGTLLLWLMTRAIVETAQHGRVGGKHSEVWFPIRFFLAVGLLVPLPPVGLNAGQYVVIGVSKMGMAGAGVLWSKAMEQLADLKPLIEPSPPEVKDLARELFRIETCRAIQNLTAATSNGATISDPLTTSRDTGVWRTLSADGDSDSGGVFRQCGAVTFRHEPGLSGSSAKILAAHEKAAMALQKQLRPAAEALAVTLLPPFTDKPAVGPNFDTTAAMQAYTATLMAAARAEVIAGNQQALQSQREAATNAGWAKAGAWAMNLMWANQTVWDAVGDLPKTTPPRYEVWEGEVYAAQKAAFVAADQWWTERYAQRKTSTEKSAYDAAIGQEAQSGILAFFDLSRKKEIYEWLLLGESDRSNNPIAEMTSLGHSLLNIFWGAVMTFAGGTAAAEAAQAWTNGNLVGWLSNTATIGTAGATAAGTKGFLSGIAPVFYFLAFALLLAGVALAYLLPMLPALHWLYGVARYFMRVIIAVLGAPIWAIAHLELEGEGIGHRAAKGYEILYDLLARPMIMVVALVAGFAVMIIFGKLFVLTFAESIGNALGGHFGGVTGTITYLILGASTIIGLADIAMMGVGKGGDLVMQMIGAHFLGTGDTDPDVNQSKHPVQQGATTGQQAAMMGSGMKGGGHPPQQPSTDGHGAGAWAPRMEDSIPSPDQPPSAGSIEKGRF